MGVNLDNMPVYLRETGRFCLWRYEDRGRRKTKVPYNPQQTDRHAASDDPETFTQWEQIEQIWQQEQESFDGIGVGVFGDLCAVDIDLCIDQDGNLSEMAKDITDTLCCYTEISPSGEGIRIFCRVSEGFSYDKDKYYINSRTAGLEVYIAGMTKKFLTFTGNTLIEGDVSVCDQEILQIVDRYMKRPAATSHPVSTVRGIYAAADLPDRELIGKARSTSERFNKLWQGDIAGYPSQSEAELALCNMLAYWTGRDAARIDRLYRQSALMRRKWERDDYRNATIQKAVKDCSEVYTLRPKDFSDLGQAAVFVQEYGHIVRYSKATGFLVYDSRVWCENDLDAQRLSQELTERQLEEARRLLKDANNRAIEAAEAAEGDGSGAAAAVKASKDYHKFVVKYRASSSISHTMTEARPALQISIDDLDRDAFLLNTPGGAVDLHTGELRENRADDYCTKITGCAPAAKGRQLYMEFLDKVTCGDKELRHYLQLIAGMCAVGNSDAEKLIIAYGDGGNGKSTLFNLWSMVLGSYAGTIPSESLIIRNSTAKDYSVAELRGKRIAIAAELREGARLSTDMVKKLCSTDRITAEKKYKDSFSYIPSHTVILYTNHLPKVGTNDSGTWDRIAVIPFNARFRNEAGEVKNYAEYLFKRCGGAVLQWIIDGAVEFIRNGSRIEEPACVIEAVEEYRTENDWLGRFISDDCNTAPDHKERASALYERYRAWCDLSGEYARSQRDFKEALEKAGYRWKKERFGAFHYGLSLKKSKQLSRDYTA